MIRDAEVLHAEFHRLIGHLFQRVNAIGLGGVAVESAAQVVELHKARQFARGGGLDLAAVFAQFGFDELQA